MSIYRYASILLLAATVHTESAGQAAKTPFSSFGIGETFGSGLTQNQGMGGLGISHPEYWHLNNVNPALLTYNTITVFEAGFLGEQRTVKGAGASEKAGSGNLNYLALGFPIKRNKWGTAIGLMPYSSVNYRLRYQSSIANSTDMVDVIESGSGGINQLYLSNGARLHPNISVGLKATYYFSAIVNQYTSSLSESSQAVNYATNIYDRRSFHGFGFTGGASFHKDSIGRKNYQVNVGVVYDFNADINTKFYERLERRNVVGIKDSVTIVNNVPGTTTIPQAMGAGISFGKELQWLVGADFTYTDYGQFKGFGGSAAGGKPGWQLAIGGKITPDAGSLDNYLKRMTYQTGVSLSEAPYLVNGNALKDFGINFGLTLPVSRVSSLDLAVKVGKRGDLQTNTIEENYFKLYFGVTFNDQWFIKRRFD
ncbi:MAG TPA: hypothetical protein PKW06_05605 [Cyclobacteriaceae bacterium]|nr:hypothetical protein [Cyclobacteriaceae bacterium]